MVMITPAEKATPAEPNKPSLALFPNEVLGHTFTFLRGDLYQVSQVCRFFYTFVKGYPKLDRSFKKFEARQIEDPIARTKKLLVIVKDLLAVDPEKAKKWLEKTKQDIRKIDILNKRAEILKDIGKFEIEEATFIEEGKQTFLEVSTILREATDLISQQGQQMLQLIDAHHNDPETLTEALATVQATRQLLILRLGLTCSGG